MGWWGPAPPRAYPARIAALARAPFALRKGRLLVAVGVERRFGW